MSQFFYQRQWYSQMTGKGSYKWTDGSTYDGIIENGKRHGKGVFKVNLVDSYLSNC